jgi:hypothetical protein
MLRKKPEVFKQCHVCSRIWGTGEELIADTGLKVNSYLADFDNPDNGRILLTHVDMSCGAILTLRAADLKPFYRGPAHSHLNRGMLTCPGHCLNQTEMSACTADCNMHWIREILQCLYRHEL